MPWPHPEQIATYEQDGSYLLKLPYSDDRELLGDILRHGADVQVLEPRALRTKVQKTLIEAATRSPLKLALGGAMRPGCKCSVAVSRHAPVNPHHGCFRHRIYPH